MVAKRNVTCVDQDSVFNFFHVVLVGSAACYSKRMRDDAKGLSYQAIGA